MIRGFWAALAFAACASMAQAQTRPVVTSLGPDHPKIAGNANNALAIPTGLGFARARSVQPELNLYAPDKRHPSLAGAYLAACTTFAALTGRSPVGDSYHADIDEQTAKFLQQVAGRRCRTIIGNDDPAAVFSSRGE